MRKLHLLFIVILLFSGNLLFNPEIKGARAEEVSSYLFETGFERDLETEFDGTVKYGREFTLDRVTSPVHHGSYALLAQVKGGQCFAYKTFTGAQQVYIRTYVYFPKLWTYLMGGQENYWLYFLMISYGYPPAIGSGGQNILWGTFRVRYFSGAPNRPSGFYWTGNYYDAPSGRQKYFPNPDNTIPTVTAGRWYCVELMLKRESSPGVADGEFRIWVDGEEIYTSSTFDELRHIQNNDEYSGPCIDTILVGIYEIALADKPDEPSPLVILDCLKVSNNYIGLELGPEPQWRLTINSNPISGVSVAVDGSPIGNTPTSLTVTERAYTVAVPSEVEGYRFVRWEDGSTSPTRTVTITADMILTAHYEVYRWQMTFNHKDMDNNSVDSVITWQLYNSTQLLTYEEGQYTLLDGTYTLKTYYHGIRIDSTSLSTATYGNTTIDTSLQMKPHTSVPNGCIVFNNTITSITINSQTDSNLTVTVSGSSPATIIADVPRNATYVQRNGVNQTNWIYLSGATPYIVIFNGSIDVHTKWEFYFPPPTPIINKWQMAWNWRDLDNNDVSPLISWQLWNGGQQLKYTQGQFTLLDGTYVLKTFLQGELINQTFLETTSYGNKTTIIKLQMKPHASVSGGYIAFNNIITSITIHSETSKDLTFTVSGSGAYKIVVKVPRNPSHIRKDGALQTGWTFDAENSVIKISTSSLSTWTLIFPVEETTPGILGSIHLLMLFLIVVTIVAVLWALNRMGHLYL